MNKKYFVSILLILSFVKISFAQNIDSLFATNGYTSDVHMLGTAVQIKVLPDNSMLVAQQRVGVNSAALSGSYIYCAKYLEDGTVDSTFGEFGAARVSFYDESNISDIDVLSNGKIIMVGEAKYCNNIVCGWHNVVIAMLNSDGSLDTSFGNNGKLIADDILDYYYLRSVWNQVEITADDKIIISGVSSISTDNTAANWDVLPYVIRLNSNGTIDSTYGPNGDGINYIDGTGAYLAYDMKINDDGSFYWITFSGNTGNAKAILFKINENGLLDSSFGTNGMAEISIIGDTYFYNALDVREDGKVIVAGYGQNSGIQDSVSVHVFNEDGSNANLLTQNKLNVYAQYLKLNDVLIANNNQFLICGDYRIGDYRYAFISLVNEDGSLDANFGNNGQFLFDFNTTQYVNSGSYLLDLEVSNNHKLLASGAVSSISPGYAGSESLLMKFKDENLVFSDFVSGLSTYKAEIKGLKLYPNPSSDFMNIEMDEKIQKLTIFNSIGNMIYMAVEGKTEIDLSLFPSGIYSIIVETKDSFAYSNFVVK